MSDLDDAVKTNFENEKYRFVTNLIFTSNWIRNGFSDFLIPFDLSSQQFNILRILRGAGDWVSMNEIKKLMIDKSPHTTRMTNKLLEKELVERKRSDKDRRVVFVSITKKGLALLAKIDIESKEIMKFTENFSLEEAKQMNAILDKLRG